MKLIRRCSLGSAQVHKSVKLLFSFASVMGRESQRGAVKKLKVSARVGSPLPSVGEGLGVRGTSANWHRAYRHMSGMQLRSLAAERNGVQRPLTPIPSPLRMGEGNGCKVRALCFRVSTARACSLLMIFHFLVLALDAQKPINQNYPPDVPPSPNFRTNRNSYSAIMDVLRPSRPSVSQEQLDRLKKLQFETIWGQLGDYKSGYVRGFTGTRAGQVLVGRALTIRYLPARPDLRRALETLAKEGDWPFGYHARAAEEAKPGDVLVVDLGGAEGTVFMGDISALGMKLGGAAGVIIDGASRDLAELRGEPFKDFPVFARFYHVSGATWVGAEWNVPVRIGTATVLPGDIVVATDEGAIFFPPELLATVLQKGTEHEALEDYERHLVREKEYRFRDVYPPAPELLKKQKDYEAKKDKSR
jgi:4-hydroxy-4-methyl-2-oxoglutarate aldolase